MEHLGQQQCELVAAETRGGVGSTQALVQPAADLDEHRIARGVSVLGVDPAEIREVDVDDADDVALRVAFEQRALDPVDEQSRIGEMGERIVEGAVRELVLQRRQPQERVVQPASLDRQRGEVGQVLEGLVVGAGRRTIEPADAECEIADRAAVVREA